MPLIGRFFFRSYLWLGLSALLAWCPLSTAASADEALGSADAVFAALRASVFQVRIVELQSGSQTALGTGFVVTAPGAGDRVFIATNYHVVSVAVMEPEKYRIEVAQDGESVPLVVHRVDVVNDLALLWAGESRLPAPFRLSRNLPRNGEILYSLGNPHNLGMTIVTGNYNVLVENQYLDRIHFSGAINSGMSGGPAVNARGQVVGINVATAGNQVGFLVPVQALAALLARSADLPDDTSPLADMAQQVATLTDGMVADLLAADWPVEPMGRAQVLGKVVPWMECWGNSQRDEETGVQNIVRGCHNNDSVFVRQGFTTGYLEYEYYHLEAPDWPSAAFYRLLRSSTSHARPGNRAQREDVGNFVCHDDRIVGGERTDGAQALRRRVSYCVRPYKRLPGLYDVFYMGVSLDGDRHGVMDHFTLAGVTRASAQAFLRRFVEVTAWR